MYPDHLVQSVWGPLISFDLLDNPPLRGVDWFKYRVGYFLPEIPLCNGKIAPKSPLKAFFTGIFLFQFDRSLIKLLFLGHAKIIF